VRRRLPELGEPKVTGSQHIDHLATCAEKIDAGITRRIQGTHSVKRKAKRLRAVP
jgi:hypothetical protein